MVIRICLFQKKVACKILPAKDRSLDTYLNQIIDALSCKFQLVFGDPARVLAKTATASLLTLGLAVVKGSFNSTSSSPGKQAESEQTKYLIVALMG